MRTWTIGKDFTFDAAHRLPHHGGACRRLHGHTYRVRLEFMSDFLQASGAAKGMVLDFGTIKDAWAIVKEKLDHRLLNEVDGLENPTAERMAAWIYDEANSVIGGVHGIHVSAVTVWETPTSFARFEL